VETARLWLDLGFYSERHGGAFCINGVTGPDEYNTVVNNNAYTNLMARHNLLAAVRAVELLRERAERGVRLRRNTDLSGASWTTGAARRTHVRVRRQGRRPPRDGLPRARVWDGDARRPTRCCLPPW
jgi:alpha,alpha-trehalose phosphorylase